MKQLSEVCYRAGTALEAGVDARNVWKREATQARGKTSAPMQAIYDGVCAGDSLIDALQRTNGYFPKLATEMINVGEQTGKTAEILLKLSQHYQQLLQLRRTFLAGLVWPGIQLLVAIGVVALLILVAGVVGGKDLDADILGFGLVGIPGVIKFFTFVLMVAAAILFLIESIRRGKFGSAAILAYVYKVPMLGPCLKTMALARMAWALSLALDAGMSARQSMRTALNGSASPVYEQLLPQIDRSLKSGTSFYQSLADTHAFPVDFLDAIETGETSGRMTQSLHHLSKKYEAYTKEALQTLTVLAGFAVWGMVAMIVIFLIFRVMSFYLGVLNGALEMAN